MDAFTFRRPEASDAPSAGVQRLGRRQAVAELYVLEVRENFVVEQRQPVANAKIVLGEGEPRLGFRAVPRDRELRPADILSTKQVTDGIDRLKLEVEIRFEVQFHD